MSECGGKDRTGLYIMVFFCLMNSCQANFAAIEANQTGGLVAKPKPSRPRHIYVIQAGLAVKIGFSRNPALRAQHIQVSSVSPVYVIFAAPLEDQEAIELERALHRVLRKSLHHIRGEWYAMPPAEPVSLVEKMVEWLQERKVHKDAA